MRLIKERWEVILQLHDQLVQQSGIPDKRKNPAEFSMYADFEIAKEIFQVGETIIFPTDVFQDILHDLHRIDIQGDFRLPYPYLIIQLTQPLPEAEVFPHLEQNEFMREIRVEPGEDKVEGLLIANGKQDPDFYRKWGIVSVKCNCLAVFESTCVNRVAWNPDEPKVADRWFSSEKGFLPLTPEQVGNKNRLVHLAYAINLFLNAPNVVVEKQEPDPKVQRKREAKGKKKLPTYHIVTIDKTQTVYQRSTGKGTSHGHMYPVRGHFRKLPKSSKKIWIPNHFRGVQHGVESMVKEVYKVKNPTK